jgi:hypothetical protein
MHRILGQIKIAQQPDERGQDAPGLCAIKAVESLANLFTCGFQS